MIDIALHVEDRDAAVAGNLIEVGIANLPVAVADGNGIKVAAVDFADFFGGITVLDLGGGGFDESAVAAKLGNAGFK